MLTEHKGKIMPYAFNDILYAAYHNYKELTLSNFVEQVYNNFIQFTIVDGGRETKKNGKIITINATNIIDIEFYHNIPDSSPHIKLSISVVIKYVDGAELKEFVFLNLFYRMGHQHSDDTADEILNHYKIILARLNSLIESIKRSNSKTSF